MQTTEVKRNETPKVNGVMAQAVSKAIDAAALVTEGTTKTSRKRKVAEVAKSADTKTSVVVKAKLALTDNQRHRIDPIVSVAMDGARYTAKRIAKAVGFIAGGIKFKRGRPCEVKLHSQLTPNDFADCLSAVVSDTAIVGHIARMQPTRAAFYSYSPITGDEVYEWQIDYVAIKGKPVFTDSTKTRAVIPADEFGVIIAADKLAEYCAERGI